MLNPDAGIAALSGCLTDPWKLAPICLASKGTFADPDYNGLDADDVQVTNVDDEVPPSAGYHSAVRRWTFPTTIHKG